MLAEGILFDADGFLELGAEGERRFRGNGFLGLPSKMRLAAPRATNTVVAEAVTTVRTHAR